MARPYARPCSPGLQTRGFSSATPASQRIHGAREDFNSRPLVPETSTGSISSWFARYLAAPERTQVDHIRQSSFPNLSTILYPRIRTGSVDLRAFEFSRSLATQKLKLYG